MPALGPEQIKHHAALPAEAHAEVAATLVHVIHVGGSTVVVVGGPAGADLGDLGGGCPNRKSGEGHADWISCVVLL
jgi:hypothetical protein